MPDNLGGTHAAPQRPHFPSGCFPRQRSHSRLGQSPARGGFYLINLGYVSLELKITDPVVGVQGMVEALAGKMGVVLLVLGAMRFFNLAVFKAMRKHTLDDADQREREKLMAQRPALPVHGLSGRVTPGY